MRTIFVPPNLEALTERIIGCAIAVHRALGPGLLESAYRDCLVIELELAGLKVAREQHVPIVYRGRRIPTSLRIDLLVEDVVVVELKAVDKVHPIHHAQVISYLKLSDRPAGLLLNFNMTSLRQGLHRVDHPQLRPRAFPVAATDESRPCDERILMRQSACPELGDD
jgi:GxxExxY protein